jgi:hypothetical protein
MTMLNWDLVWQRVSKLAMYAGRKQGDFRFSAIGKQLSMTSGQSQTATQDFPQSAIIIGISAGVSSRSVAATAEIRGLNCVRLGLDYSGSKGSIITGGRMNCAALFGNTGNRLFPGREILVEQADTLNIATDNLSTSTIDFDLVFFSMILGSVQ